MAHELRYHVHLASWLTGYQPNNPNLLYENTTLGTLSTDGKLVFAVDDFTLPPQVWPVRGQDIDDQQTALAPLQWLHASPPFAFGRGSSSVRPGQPYNATTSFAYQEARHGVSDPQDPGLVNRDR